MSGRTDIAAAKESGASELSLSDIRHRLPVETYVFALLIAVWTLLAIFAPYFWTVRNITNILRQVSIDGVLAFACLLPILLARIDLSVGSVAGFTGVVFAITLAGGEQSAWVALAAALATGVAIGLLHGWAIDKLGIPAFIATLAGLQAYRGLALISSGGMTITGVPPELQAFALSTVAGIPTLFLVMLGIGIVLHVMLNYTPFGRYMYAIGSNVEAARRVGINVTRVSTITFVLTALLSTIAGLLLVARLSMGNPTAGTGAELQAIAAAVVGGASLFGGRGTVLGCFVGALLFTTMSNGANLLGVNPFWQLVIEGVLIGIVVYFDNLQKRRQAGAV